MKSMKGLKRKKEKKVIHPSLNGKANKQDATLAHNAHTDRYSLHIDGILILSAAYFICLNRAIKHGVVWEK